MTFFIAFDGLFGCALSIIVVNMQVKVNLTTAGLKPVVASAAVGENPVPFRFIEMRLKHS